MKEIISATAVAVAIVVDVRRFIRASLERVPFRAMIAGLLEMS
jgi:hypothetical protein